MSKRLIKVKSSVTSWKKSSLTVLGAGTIANAAFFEKRIGDTNYFRGSFTTGTATATSVAIQLPPGMTIDSSKMPTHASGQKVGFWQIIVSSGSENNALDYATFHTTLFFDGTITNQVFFAYSTQSSAYVKKNGDTILTTNDRNSIEFSVPILGWS